MFPFSFSKTIEIPIKGNAAASVSKSILSTLEGYIRAHNPRDISLNEHQIIFSDSLGAFRFISTWNVLSLIDRGVVEILPGEDKVLVSYKLWFTGLIFSASLFTIAVMLCVFSSGFTLRNFVIALGIWLCYFGFHFIKTVMHFDSLVHSALEP
jgi:hypothetical protein